MRAFSYEGLLDDYFFMRDVVRGIPERKREPRSMTCGDSSLISFLTEG